MSTSCYSISLSMYFPRYDCSNGDIYTASREDCIDISTGVCALQWILAINYEKDCLIFKSYHLVIYLIFCMYACT